MSDEPRIALDSQMSEVAREIETRKRVYGRLVREKKMNPRQADAQIRRMQAVLQTLQMVAAGKDLFDVR